MGLILRPTTIEDGTLLYRWRIEDENTAGWWQGTSPSLDEHLTWLEDRLLSPACRIYIAETKQGPVGQIRLDSNGEVSYSVIPEARGHGYGALMLRLVTGEHADRYGGRLKACVDKRNRYGGDALEQAGFRHRPDVLFLRWPE